MVENIIIEMIELTEKKLESLDVILNLKSKQKEVIDQENMDDLSTIIDSIQEQINIIDKIDSLYILKLNELKSSTGMESIAQLNNEMYPKSRVLQDKLSKTNSKLQLIKALDDENNHLINEKFQETKDMLKNLRQGKKMAKGYFTEYNGTMFIDERN
ncbi:hypothetical protein DW1_0335 [Proteiniborus sp. DW1]|uniref:flagellar export chaperone FlgN n=1 Tax=Proteiniborus sp. DW1 TaxID=1889883 RepID=UPI00092DFD71|nr:flagellar export chaperone FlgN [Proteiniborus sp. DW1]SCG81955.1 hypothetical protein DW1_0335 [Proteiniborus sp. DW1]